MNRLFSLQPLVAAILTGIGLMTCSTAYGGTFKFTLREQKPIGPDEFEFRSVQRAAEWEPSATAVIVCDVWDYHHCLNAVRRLNEFAPRLNEFVTKAREQGATIIHAPSDCMAFYADHPARTRATSAPAAAKYPVDITRWCMRIPAEEQATYPIDQSDGGEDDDPQDHADWAAELTKLGRDPKRPWKRQLETIAIDGERDYISDRGDEVWNILESRGIKNVILTGVHTNMCVLGRPFGLRRMVLGGKNAVLVRDLTDTMYNPAQWPFVSHFTANDLIATHIERYVCPTITSDQLLGGRPFRFSGDKRPRLAIVVAEEGYGTRAALSDFAAMHLGKSFRVSYAFGSKNEPNEIPGLEILDEADVALLSIRRKVLKPEAMAIVRRYVAASKPIVAIRTTSHAFCLKDKPPPEGYVDWPDFDREVLGGNYHGHLNDPNDVTFRIAPGAEGNPLLAGFPQKPEDAIGGLYQMSPLSKGTTLLVVGDHAKTTGEPVAWTFRRADGGKSFYSSMGHELQIPSPFLPLLFNALHWAADLPLPPADQLKTNLHAHAFDHWWKWRVADVPWFTSGPARKLKTVWIRSAACVPDTWTTEPIDFTVIRGGSDFDVWINGHALPKPTIANLEARFAIESEWITPGSANLVVVRRRDDDGRMGCPWGFKLSHGDEVMRLDDAWQCRASPDDRCSNMPLPAQFGASPDMVHDRVIPASEMPRHR
jgi:nicotinamidase-related amidase